MLVKTNRFIAILIALVLHALVFAQTQEEFRIENITSEYTRTEQGLSQNSVNCVLQDDRGFLWVGTWSGLNRFDGYNVKILTKDYLNPERSLTHATVVGLVQDKQGYIWAATSHGLNRIDPITFEIKKFTSEEHGPKGFNNDSLASIYYDSEGLIWLGTSQGAISLDPEIEKFTHYHHNPRDTRTLSNGFVTCFEEDHTNLWIGTRNGLNCLIRSTGQILSYSVTKELGQLSSSEITSLSFGNDGYLWIGTADGLNRLNIERNWFDSYYLIPTSPSFGSSTLNHITSIHNDNGNDLWVGTQELGLYLFDKESRAFNNLSNFTEDASIINTNEIQDITEDRNGLYWVGTAHRGLVKLVPETNAFKSYLQGKATFGVEEGPDGKMWFGTQNGVYRYDREAENVDSIFEYEYNKSNSISSNKICNLFRDGPIMWIATRNGLNKYDTSTDKIEHFFTDGTENTICGNEVWGIEKTIDGTLWFSTQSGVSNYDPVERTFKNYRHDPNNPNSISSNQCYQVFELTPDELLISTTYGLNRFNRSTNTWEVFLPIAGDLTSISSEYVFGVFRDSNGEIWVYTNAGGINRFDPNTNTFESFNILDGLADNIVYGITEDTSGHFWIITNNGLSRFEPLEERFVKYDVQDGLLSNEFNLNGFYQTSKGEIFAAGANGISSFFPPSTIPESEQLSVQFTNLAIHQGGEAIEMPLSPKIKLDFDQNTFHIGFAALDYRNPFKNRFEYKLENYDNEFTSLEPGFHSVEYRKLPPGVYKLRIIGSNTRGISAENSIDIIVVSAWWQTLLFKVLVSVFSIGLITFIVLIRYNANQNKHKMDKALLTIQNELVQSQKFALRSQMNPHFIFNALNSIQNFVLKNDVDAANYYLSNFSILMRKVLEYSQYNFITLHEEIQLIELYIKMEKLRFSNKFDIVIEVDPDIDEHDVKIPPMLLQPYLENAILHGLQLIKHKGILAVRFNDLKTAMDIEIEDNGIGRAKAYKIRSKQAHISKGLKNIEKRIQLYNKINTAPIEVSITDLFDNDQPKGTMVKLRIPYALDEPES